MTETNHTSDLERCRAVLRATLDYSRERDYAGYDKHDALNSKLLATLLGRSKWTRLAAIQAVARAPWNVRPLLGVPRPRNPKGIGLFAHALLDRYAATGEAESLREARRLLDWLLENPASGYRGLSWGYPYPWQDVGFYAPRHAPNRVVTCWIGLAFVEAVWATHEPRYKKCLTKIADFLTGEPNVLCDTPAMKCYSYVPSASVTWAVMDVPALVGAFLAQAGALLDRKPYREEATRLIRWVVDKQTDYGAWYYTDPPGDSHVTHDNYHTGILLDCLDRYRAATGDARFDAAYWKGLTFYGDHLFQPDGAPRWMHDKPYPHDVHGAAAGILCFLRAAGRRADCAETAARILDWTLSNLYDERGFFYYQKTARRTKRFCLMRWCNAWMARAIAAYLRHHAS